MPISESALAPYLEPLRFRLPDSEDEISIPPITLDQARRALLLDPADGQEESDRDALLRLHAQFKVLVGPPLAYLTGVLTIIQAREVVAAIYQHACGQDAAQYARSQTARLQGGGGQPGVYDTLRRLQGVRIDLATALDMSPSELGAMPLVRVFALHADLQLAEAGQAPVVPGPAFKRF